MTQYRIRLALTLGALLAVIPAWSSDTALAAECGNGYMQGLTALTDLGTGLYLGQQGGLYPGGTNTIPSGHAALGMDLAGAVQPRDASGAISASGSVVLLAIGVSNTDQQFGAFQAVVAADARIDPQLILVNGGVSGAPVDSWQSLSAPPWGDVDTALDRAGATDAQVQVVWIMLPDRNPTPAAFPIEERAYQEKLAVVLRNLRTQFPNLQLAFMSSLTYTGYGPQHEDAEPISYREGFGVKWVIESQINGSGNLNPDPAKGAVVAPWIAWGPYMWANGVGPDNQPGGQPGRADGLEWLCSDFQTDGIHLSAAGEAKSAAMLFTHFSTTPTSCDWFFAAGIPCGTGPVTGPVAGSPFADIGSSQFFNDILWLAEQGITAGCQAPPNALFCPDGLVTRGQMAAFLVRGLGYTDNGGGDLFIDDDGSIFEESIDRLATAGVTSGCKAAPDPMFCPEGFVTRGEMAAFLHRALGA